MMHGPGYDPNASYYYAPTWPTPGLVDVYDGVYNTLKPRKQAKWYALVQYALQQWAPCGLELVHHLSPPNWMFPDTDQDFINAAVHPYLTLARMTHKFGGKILGAGGWWPSPNGTEQGSIAAFHIGKTFWALGRWNQRLIVTHEIGHALGLKHNPSTKSVLYGGGWTSNTPDAHDIDSLQDYYL